MKSNSVNAKAQLPPTGPNCTPPAIDDFPRDIFSETERRNGAVIVHVLISLYLFIALAVVCDKFFVPAVGRICKGKSPKSAASRVKLGILPGALWREVIDPLANFFLMLVVGNFFQP